MPGTMIFDFDDVLVNLSSKVFSGIRKNWRIFNRWLVDSGPLTEKELMARQVYPLNEWLIKKDVVDMTSKQYLALQLLLRGEMKRMIFSDPKLYDDLEPTEFAKRTLMNRMYIENSTIKQVIILSRNVTDAQSESKKRFIRKYFNNSKIEYIPIEVGESKADKLEKDGIHWDMFIDDELPNIRAVAEKFNLERKEFLIPEYGYNKMDIYLKSLIEGKGGMVTYFDPYK